MIDLEQFERELREFLAARLPPGSQAAVTVALPPKLEQIDIDFVLDTEERAPDE